MAEAVAVGKACFLGPSGTVGAWLVSAPRAGSGSWQ
jgi:hypothetical protein